MPSMPKPPSTTLGLVQFVFQHPLGIRHFGGDHLGDAHQGFDGEGGFAVVDEDYADFASVIAVDGAGGV